MTNPRTRTLAGAVAAGLLAASGIAMAHEQKFEEMDTDGNGVITTIESDEVSRALHDRADRDNDGRVTAEELENLYRELARESGKEHHADTTRSAGSKAHGGQGMDIGDAMREMDSNNDGAISRDEFMATARGKLEMSDLDGDGSVTRAEYEEARSRAKEDERRRDSSGGAGAARAGGR